MKFSNIRKFFVPLALLLISALAFTQPVAAAIVDGAEDGGRPLFATLTGAAEVPNPGDPDGSGWALITLNQGEGTVCWQISVAGITLPASAAHIHKAPAGVPGGVVVALSAPDAWGSATGCRSGVSTDLIQDIRQNPDQYYVNVHNSDYPAGAVRGQLSK